ncbi:MAG: hypothetical protein ACFHU9_06795 [Fluviicola sp.]
MKKVKYVTSLLILLSIALIGCQRGCTTASTMASESKSFKMKGEKIVITARLVDYRNSRAISRRNIFKRKVTHTYGIVIDIESRLYTQRSFYSEGVPNPDKVNLKSVLKRAKVAISKDKKHVAIGVDDQVVDLVHLYRGKPLRSNNLHSPQIPGSWSQLDINSYPSPKEMLLSQIEDDCKMIMLNEDALRELLDNTSPNDKAHHLLLAQWPNCDFAIEYYDAKQIARCSKNKNWKKRAEKRALESLEGSGYSHIRFEEEYNAFLLKLQSKEVMKALDQQYVDNWGSHRLNVDLVIQRMQHASSPMDSEQKETIIADATKEIKKFMRSGRSNHNREAADCIQILVANNQTELVKSFLKDAVNRPSKYAVFDLLECVLDVYEIYPSADQQFILSNLDKIMKSIPDYARDSMIRRGENFIPCDQIRNWIQEYPDDLDKNDLPDRC